MERDTITRLPIAMTDAQYAAVLEMIQKLEKLASGAAGMPVRIGTRQFFHTLLKAKAGDLGVDWPEDYPSSDGQRGRPQQY